MRAHIARHQRNCLPLAHTHPALRLAGEDAALGPGRQEDEVHSQQALQGILMRLLATFPLKATLDYREFQCPPMLRNACKPTAGNYTKGTVPPFQGARRYLPDKRATSTRAVCVGASTTTDVQTCSLNL